MSVKALWALAGVLAVAVVIGTAYGRPSDDKPKATVMVAEQLIPAGTMVRGGTFAFVTLPKDEIEAGTITDVRYIAYHLTAHEIFPGETLAGSDFAP
jgi:Flp pilus assembly protein CpaB